ncbi:MAG: 8-oxoguanine deaminase [Anaerolineaceae bacterium]|nr:8-oxoguanine deaminase [Anaerolineaceae bacterium]
MSTLLVKNITKLITNDKNYGNLDDAGIFVVDNVIAKVGPQKELPQTADVIIDASNKMVCPGFVNTHHHFYQTLTRAVPGAMDEKLFDWLVRLYPIWGELDPDSTYLSSLIAMAELILSGCTTASDHQYIWPHGALLDDQIRAANEIGMRFHAVRGSMTLGRSQGGLPPDHVVQTADEILKDSQRVIEKYHDNSRFAMTRVVLAPCSPFSVDETILVKSAELARSYPGVMLHTHVAETQDEEKFTMQRAGLRPVRYMEKLGWVGPDVWWAHCIWLNSDEIKLMAETGTGVAHCPSSNMRLGSGIAPIREMLDAGVKVGLGVDGSASNDSSHMIAEGRMAMLLQRVAKGADALTINETLSLETTGGASVLGRDDIGIIKEGMAADFIGINLNTVEFAGGACHDPLAALFLCTPPKVDFSVINGKKVAENGALLTVDLEKLIAKHNETATKMVKKYPVPERYKLV